MNKEEQEQWEYEMIDNLVKICRDKYSPEFSALVIDKLFFVITNEEEGK